MSRGPNAPETPREQSNAMRLRIGNVVAIGHAMDEEKRKGRRTKWSGDLARESKL